MEWVGSKASFRMAKKAISLHVRQKTAQEQAALNKYRSEMNQYVAQINAMNQQRMNRRFNPYGGNYGAPHYSQQPAFIDSPDYPNIDHTKPHAIPNS